MDERQYILSMYANEDVSGIPCNICGGAVVEFSIPNDIWNCVMRPDGHEHDGEYLCMACFFDALRKTLGLQKTFTNKRDWAGFRWENNGGITEILCASREPGMWAYLHYVNGIGVAGGEYSESFLHNVVAHLPPT